MANPFGDRPPAVLRGVKRQWAAYVLAAAIGALLVVSMGPLSGSAKLVNKQVCRLTMLHLIVTDLA